MLLGGGFPAFRRIGVKQSTKIEHHIDDKTLQFIQRPSTLATGHHRQKTLRIALELAN